MQSKYRVPAEVDKQLRAKELADEMANQLRGEAMDRFLIAAKEDLDTYESEVRRAVLLKRIYASLAMLAGLLATGALLGVYLRS